MTMFDHHASFPAICRSLLLPLCLAVGLGACSATMAQTQYNDVPVLIVAEDEKKITVKRSSEIHKRVIARLKNSMKRTGFRMIDEESVAVDLGWKIKDRRKRTELIRLAKNMATSGKAVHQVRAMVTFRVHAYKPDGEDSGIGSVQVRINGEIYDIPNNEFIDEYEMPLRKFVAPADCETLCIHEVVGGRAREIAASLGVILAQKLAHYRDASAGQGPTAGGGRAVTGDGATGSGTGHTMPLNYTVTLGDFSPTVADTIIGVMTDGQWPGYKTHTLISQHAAIRPLLLHHLGEAQQDQRMVHDPAARHELQPGQGRAGAHQRKRRQRRADRHEARTSDFRGRKEAFQVGLNGRPPAGSGGHPPPQGERRAMSIAEFLPEPGRSFFMRPLRGGAFARAIRAVFEFALPGDNPRSPARLVSSRTAALIVASCVALTPASGPPPTRRTGTRTAEFLYWSSLRTRRPTWKGAADR